MKSQRFNFSTFQKSTLFAVKSILNTFVQTKIIMARFTRIDVILKMREAGVTCVGIGSNLITKELIQKRDWKGLTKRIAGAVKVARMFQIV